MDKPSLCLIVGPSGCGKTITLLYEILGPNYESYDNIVIICPTLKHNKSYREWPLMPKTNIHEVIIDESKLDRALKYIVKVCSEYSKTKTAVIIDDMSYGDSQHKSTGSLAKIATSGRHIGISLFILTQKLNSVSTLVRQNTTRVIFFRTHNNTSQNILKNEFFGLVSKDEATKVINNLRKQKFNCYIDISADPDCPEPYKICRWKICS